MKNLSATVNIWFLLLSFHTLSWHPAMLELVDGTGMYKVWCKFWRRETIIGLIVVVLLNWWCIFIEALEKLFDGEDNARTRDQIITEKQKWRAFSHEIWGLHIIPRLMSPFNKGTGNLLRTCVPIFGMCCVLSYAATNFPVCSNPEPYFETRCKDVCPKKGFHTGNYTKEERNAQLHNCTYCHLSETKHIALVVKLQCQTMALAPQLVGGAFGKIVVKTIQDKSERETSCKGTSEMQRELQKKRKNQHLHQHANNTSFLQKIFVLAFGLETYIRLFVIHVSSSLRRCLL